MPGCGKRKNWCMNGLRGGGYRMTVTRQSIINVLNTTKEHLSAEDIFEKVKNIHEGIGLASVYRNLELLIELNLVHKHNFGEGKSRYEITTDENANTNHHHLICTSCGKIVDYDEILSEEKSMSKNTEQKLTKKYGFSIERHNVQYLGTCKKCIAAN